MAEESEQQVSRIFYRRVPPDRWRTDDREMPEESAFHLRKNEQGLSVYDASKVKGPDDLLQKQIDLWSKQQNNKKLAECGGTVEGMRKIGWGVASFEEQCVISSESSLSFSSVANDGHVEIRGSIENVEIFASIVVEECKKC